MFEHHNLLKSICQPMPGPEPLSIEQLETAATQPVLTLDAISCPVKISSIELLRNGNTYLVRARSTEGAEGIALANTRASYFYPILLDRIIPYFVDKDARQLESLVDEVYVHNSNYKLSGLSLWCCVAWVEFCLLDLLGKIAGQSIGELLGGVVRQKIPVYIASGHRDNNACQEVEFLARRIAETGANAVKFKIGGRMSNNADSLPGRTEQLIQLARKVLGDDVVLHADANGSYTVDKAIEIGKILEANNVYFFEEPCPFDHLEETQRVAQTLSIPVAAGEQETSLRRFRWMIHNKAVQIVQPDLNYNGGFIRTTRVARMAAVAGVPITVHVSGSGACYMTHFASCTPNIGEFQEYKDLLPKANWHDPPLKVTDGVIEVPTSPGLGITIDPQFLASAKPLR